MGINIKPANANQQINLSLTNGEKGRRLFFGVAASMFFLFALPMVSIAQERKSKKKMLIDQFLGKNYYAST